MDFHELERLVAQIVAPWHNRHLNEVAPFSAGRQTAVEWEELQGWLAPLLGATPEHAR